jgi:hypothetical protein
MRSDMGRVVIERPRYGSSNKSPKIRHFGGRIDDENDYDGVTRLPSSRGRIEALAPKTRIKDFTDVLGPLRRYLHKNVGRPWDKIHSEAVQSLKSGGWGVEHVFSAHFLREVEREVYRNADGVLMQLTRDDPVTGFCVDPKTKLLRYIPRHSWKRKAEPRETRRIPRADGRSYVLIGDLWFLAHYEDWGALTNSEQTNLIRRGGVNDWPNIRAGQNRLWICRVEKSCGRKELKEIRKSLK